MRTQKGVIDSEGLDVMQEALERACKELDVRREDQFNRKRIAFLVVGFTRAGVYDLDSLTSRVVTQFKIKV
jgi:hypothetical protein